MLDLCAENRQFSIAETKQMQMMKTGALLSAAVICGGIVGGASKKLLAAQTAFAQHLGPDAGQTLFGQQVIFLMLHLRFRHK